MSLTITIDRTEAGGFRAEVGENSLLVIESNDLPALIEELKRKLDKLALTPDGRLLFVQAGTETLVDEVAARAEVERAALRNQDLDELIDRYPVPAEWGQEPGWSDAV
jgi:hypothetical protein